MVKYGMVKSSLVMKMEIKNQQGTIEMEKRRGCLQHITKMGYASLKVIIWMVNSVKIKYGSILRMIH